MNEYMSELYEIETRREVLERKEQTEEVKQEIEELNLRLKAVREQYLNAMGKITVSKLKKEEAELRQMLFDIRYQIKQFSNDSESTEYQQTVRRMRVVRRELAHIKYNIEERGKKDEKNTRR